MTSTPSSESLTASRPNVTEERGGEGRRGKGGKGRGGEGKGHEPPTIWRKFTPMCEGNYSTTSNNMKSVHWPLMGGLLNLVQR